MGHERKPFHLEPTSAAPGAPDRTWTCPNPSIGLGALGGVLALALDGYVAILGRGVESGVGIGSPV